MSDGQVLYRKSLYLLPNFVVNVKLLFSLSYFIYLFIFATLYSLWDLMSPIRDWTQTMAGKAQNANH